MPLHYTYYDTHQNSSYNFGFVDPNEYCLGANKGKDQRTSEKNILHYYTLYGRAQPFYVSCCTCIGTG